VSSVRRLLPDAARLLREAARHVLRRPVVGVAVAAQAPGERWLLIRRRDTGGWALPGGTLEWGETLLAAARRELLEEAGVVYQGPFELCGVYSSPVRDYRFHAVTVLLRAQVSEPERAPMNSLEIADVRLFASSDLPSSLSLSMTDMLADARTGRRVLE
jgi:8-oxo-dGTP diphosphatase